MRATVSDGVRPPAMHKSPVKRGFLWCRGDDRRWRRKLCEGGLGALGEIRTPDPRIRGPKLIPNNQAAALASNPDV